MLLASIQKIPQKLDAGQRSIQLDGIPRLLKLYMHTFRDELEQISNILESFPTPQDHITQTFSVEGYYRGVSMASNFL